MLNRHKKHIEKIRAKYVASTSSVCCFRAAAMEAESSGKLVPIATTVNPTKPWSPEDARNGLENPLEVLPRQEVLQYHQEQEEEQNE